MANAANELWQKLFLEPADLADEAAYADWFAAIAQRLLCGTKLKVGEVPHRFTEIEFYYHGGKHLDIFTHRDPIQKGTGQWYFHRTNGVYRGGSFKGFDLTFGSKEVYGGILIRGIEEENGEQIDGPSLSVDHLLKSTEALDVATLDEAIAGRVAWDPDNPLSLEWAETMTSRTILRTARVGLSLKKQKKSDTPTRFILKRYRFLSEPKKISKGKAHMILALHNDGKTPEEIRAMTGGTKASIAKYIEEYAEGQKKSGFDEYFGAEIGTSELCTMHGLWQKMYG
jgi:3-methyladenine DNA glycosylase Mpg